VEWGMGNDRAGAFGSGTRRRPIGQDYAAAGMGNAEGRGQEGDCKKVRR
jgi:hypothetical protein